MLAPKATLIIAFYNNVKSLDVILKALMIQSEKSFEVVIADDGSKQDAVDFIKKKSEEVPFVMKHVWHEDTAFRKTRILNRAILASESDYLIVIDGDCIPQKYFIEDHVTQSEKGRVLAGRRIELPDIYSERVLNSESPGTFFDDNKAELLFRYFFTKKKGTKDKGRHIENGLRVSSPYLRKLFFDKKTQPLLGCNMSFFKEDILKINGFDMRFEAPCLGEDCDIEFRLNLIGIKNKSLKLLAPQIHLYHPELSRQSPHSEMYREILKKKESWTEFGIDTLKK